MKSRACLVEFDIQQQPLDVVEVLLARRPEIVGFGVYIWNVAQTTEVIATLKRVRPDLTVILGGPEVSFEVEAQEIVRLADYVITGEADLEFAGICAQLLAGHSPPQKIIAAEPPDLNRLTLPYDLYTEDDVAHRGSAAAEEFFRVGELLAADEEEADPAWVEGDPQKLRQVLDMDFPRPDGKGLQLQAVPHLPLGLLPAPPGLVDVR